METIVLRLKPKQDLRKSIEENCRELNITAGWIITCVGSLTQYNLRFANQQQGTKAEGYYEILSLSGTISINGCHLHISLADETGKTIGGHLLEGCLIYTTAEIVLQTDPNQTFIREKDPDTGFAELRIVSKSENDLRIPQTPPE